eukprot:scaffold143163_cov23-Cyclotella_meneghiniana.AAC.1
MSSAKLLLPSMIVATVNASSLRNMQAFNPNPANQTNPSAAVNDDTQSSCNLTPQRQDGANFLDLSDQTLLIRNAASARCIHTPDNDVKGRKSL